MGSSITLGLLLLLASWTSLASAEIRDRAGKASPTAIPLRLASTVALPAPSFAAPWLSFNTSLSGAGGTPVALATGDVDHDGDLDVVAARGYQNGGFVFLPNEGAGRLGAPVSYAGTVGAAGVVMADLNADGHLDVAVTDSDALTVGNTVSIYFGNGAGTFAARQAVSVGTGSVVPNGIEAADFDVDGDVDLAVAAFGFNGIGSTMVFLRNNGNGSFASPVSYPAGSAPYDVAAGDLTGDGRPDLVIANRDYSFTFLRNNGAGGFAAPVAYPLGGQDAGNGFPAVSIADLDVDGDFDVLYGGTQTTDGTTGHIVQFRNDGTGVLTRAADIPLATYSGGPADVATADMNGDGAADILAASYSARSSDGIYVILNNGAGSFGAAALYPAGQATFAVAAADLDGNGALDALTADDYSRAVTVRLNPGSGSFAVLPDDYAEFIQTFQDAADIDGDGDLDIFTSGPHPSASNGAILRNDGTGRFPNRTSIANPLNGVAAGVLRDLNGDGRPDLLFNNANTASQYDFFTALNNGDGTFAAPTRWVVGSAGWGQIDAFDLDGDGDLDVVDMEAEGAPNIPDGRFFIAKNNGNGTFQTPYSYDLLPHRPSDVVAGDFDEDGKLDLAMTNNGAYGFDTSVFIVRGHGDGTFDSPLVYTVARGPLYLVAADLDRDGHLDLATVNTGYDIEGAESVTLLFGTGGGTFTRLQTYTAPYSPDLLGATGIAAGDMDADGDLDLMTTGVSNDIAIYLNDGTGTFAFPYRLGAIAGAHFPIYGEFTGDGLSDLAVLSARPALGFDSGVAVLRGIAGSGQTKQLLNISTRMQVKTGDQVMIAGFIITGTDPKRVIIRGTGPSLTANGTPIADRLADPTLELHQPSGPVITNDNWKVNEQSGQSQEANIRATTIPPAHDLESAIIATLPPGNYSAVLAGKAGGTGLGVVEVYDLDQSANSQLANISTRGFVDTGDNVMIGGLIVEDDGSVGTAKVIVRALGPSVPVAGALVDPILELHNESGTTIASNDNWKARPDGSSQQAEIEATTLPPPSNLESALVTTLAPGNYTAIVRGKNNTSGIGLVEVYHLK